MDFNVKKLASDAGVFFTRAVQVNRPTGRATGQASLHRSLGAAAGQADPGDAVGVFPLRTIFLFWIFKVLPINIRFVFEPLRIRTHQRSVNSSLHPLLMAAIECWNHHVIPPGVFLRSFLCTVSLALELVHARAHVHIPMSAT